jgi:hypothetical protein
LCWSFKGFVVLQLAVIRGGAADMMAGQGTAHWLLVMLLLLEKFQKLPHNIHMPMY